MLSAFLQGQMDYICFFYGLAFVGLGVVCYILSQEVSQRLPWKWLALFGFTHGLYEWLDLPALAWPDWVWLWVICWILRTASFLFLVEFGRLSLIRQRGRGPGRGVLVLLALGAGLGALWGWAGLNASSRAILGMAGGLGAGWGLCAEGRKADLRGRHWLTAAGLGFLLYGLSAGVVVPRAEFIPAAQINYETFTSLTGLPIQLVRGLLALGIGAMIAGYFQVSWAGTPERQYRHRARSLYAINATLAVILVSGWFLTQSLDNLARKESQQHNSYHAQLIIQNLAVDISAIEDAVMSLSDSPWIGPALWSPSPQNLAKANTVLDRYQQKFRASVAYLMDASGVAIASSNREAPDSFVGHSYAFRPYFQEARSGYLARSFALGVTSKKRGFYAAQSVTDPSGKIVGVAVLKINLNKFQEYLSQFDPAFLVDPQGIVFASSRPNLDFHSLWTLPAIDTTLFKARYGTDEISPIFPQPLLDGREAEFAGKVYLVCHQDIQSSAAPGWSLVLLTPMGQVVLYRLIGIGAAFVLVVLTLITAGSNLSVREGANRIVASEARFQAMFDAAPEAVFVFDPETRRIIDANPFMAQWLGYEPAELLNLEIDKILEPEAPAAREGAGEGQETPTARLSRRYRRKDGSLVDVELTTARIFHGDQVRELVFVRDITARRQAENALRQKQEYLENMLDNSADPMGIVDRKGRVIRWNKASAEVFGYSLDEIEGKSSFDLYADKEELHHMLAQLRRDGSVRKYEIYLKKKDGTIAPFALSISLLYDRAQQMIGSMCVARDRSEIKKTLDDLATANQRLQHEVTERQRAEAELARDARIDASAADLSRALLSSLPLEEITNLVTLHAKNLTDSPRAFCGHINPQTGILEVPSLDREGCGVEESRIVFHKFGGLWGWVLEHQQALVTNNPSEDLRSAGIPPGHFPIRRFLSVPAIIEGKLVGQIGLANADHDYTAWDQEVCERLARLYALAIHRHRLDETLRESESGLQAILDNVQTGILIIDPQTHIILDTNPEAVRMIGMAKEQIIGHGCQQFMCRAEGDKCPFTDLHETLHNSERILLRANGEKAWILKTVLPMTLRGKTYLLESFVDITARRQAEDAVQAANAQLQFLVAQVEARNRTMALANEMADMLQACQLSEEAYEAIDHFMPRFFPHDTGALYMLNNSRNLFEAVASWGEARLGQSVFAPDECWAVRRGRLHLVENAQQAPRCRHVPESMPGSYLCVPLIAQGDTLGLFHLRLGDRGQEPAADSIAAQEQLALAIAEDLALSLHNLRLRESLKNQAIRDPLTGLYNRRYLEETMEREMNRVKRQKAPLGVIMMDLDHFKQYNDTFGHSAGDEMLKALGNLVKTHIRGEDIACRYGGEEFLLIMPGTSVAIARERAENLRQAVKEMHLQYKGLNPSTLSLGVAAYPDHGDTGAAIIQVADAALYRAKRAGRDRVMVAEDDHGTQTVCLPAQLHAPLKAR